MKGLILAGGVGTRLRPLTHTGSKQLIPIANKPVIHHVIKDLVDSGITERGIIVGYTKKRIASITNSVGDGSKFNAKITYIEQDAPRGIAHAVAIAKDFLKEDDFVVYLGDNMIKGGIKSFVEKFKEEKPDISLLLAKHEKPHKFGVAVIDENNAILNVEEKPENPKSNFVITGIYIFTKDIFEAIKQIKPGKNGELHLTDTIDIFVKDPTKNVKAHKVNGWWDDTGNAEAILNANYMILMDIKTEIKGTISEKSKIIGNVKIGENTKIHEGCLIKGPVAIGKDCEIGPNTYIGPYTSIGNKSKIKSGEIESSIIIGETNIELTKDDKITDSLIGKNSKITSKRDKLPKGNILILGENSELRI